MGAFPPPPVNTIDWSNVGFGSEKVSFEALESCLELPCPILFYILCFNGHIESTYSVHTGKWTPLKYVADPFIRIHGMAPALNYGQQAYEGLKAFRLPGDKEIALFRPDKNAKRMQHSAEVVCMPPVPEDLFVQACKAAVALNAGYVPPHETGAAMYIRPQIYGSSAQLGLTAPEEYTFLVFVIPTGVYHGVHPVKGLILEDFDRAAPNGTGHVKVGGNYAPVLRWSDKARTEGYGITLHLDSVKHEEIDEFSTSAFIGVQTGPGGADDITLVVPDSKSVIDSVTSDSVLAIAKSFGWKVEKRPIKYGELSSFSEVFAAGTAAALVPIRSITRRGTKGLGSAKNVTVSGDEETVTYIPESQEEPGPVCLKVLAELKGIQLGKREDKFGWRFTISEADTKGIEGTENWSADAETVDQMD